MAATLALTIVGCGGTERSTRDSVQPPRPFSARFVERTDFNVEGERWRGTTRGAFDWDAMEGWATERSEGLVTRTVQIGDRCFRRSGRGRWKESRARDPQGTCSFALFQSPERAFELLQQVADLDEVGEERLRGAQTTRYRGSLSIGAVQGPVEVWVDDLGVVRRERQEGGDGGFVSTRDYFDFGVDVNVAPPRG
jgi:hypothetical protein